MRILLVTAFLIGTVWGQDGRFIDVRQIMKGTFELLRNAPPPPGLEQMSKMITPLPVQPYTQKYVASTPPPVQKPVLTYEQIQLIRKLQARQPLTTGQLQQLQQIQQAYEAYQKQIAGSSPRAQPYRERYEQYDPTQQYSILPTINRMFAMPNENDIQRLVKLPADILYKMAAEGRYIDADSSQGLFEQPANRQSSLPFTDDEKPAGIFGEGFNFNLQGDTDGSTTPESLPPVTETTTATPEPSASEVDTLVAFANAAKKLQETNRTEESFERSSMNHTKPYFVYLKNDGKEESGYWALSIPQPDNLPAIQIPVSEIAKLSESLVKASARAGMTSQVSVQEPVSTPEPAAEVNKPEKSDGISFVQENESPVVQKQETVNPMPAEQQPQPKPQNPMPVQNLPEPSPQINLPNTEPRFTQAELLQALSQRFAAANAPAALPVLVEHQRSESPALISDTNAFQPALFGQARQDLTPEQQVILQELQRRILQKQYDLQQQEIAQMMQSRQSGVQGLGNTNAPPPPMFVMAEPVQQPQQPLTSSANYGEQQTGSSYIGKIQNNMSPYQYSVKEQTPQAFAAPVQVIKNTQPSLYTLSELDEFYRTHVPLPVAEETKPRVTDSTTKSRIGISKQHESVFAPHKQVQIKPQQQFGGDSKAQVVSSIATAAEDEKTRVADLRRQFALERQQLSRRSHLKVARTSTVDTSKPQQTPIVTEQHCYNIRSFARQYGVRNVRDYAQSHCHFIENYYPDLKCVNVNDYMEICEKYYMNRRMLFS